MEFFKSSHEHHYSVFQGEKKKLVEDVLYNINYSDFSRIHVRFFHVSVASIFYVHS